LYLILQHEFCGLASFWRGLGNPAGVPFSRCRFWQGQHNIQRLAGGREHYRLTLPANCRQIADNHLCNRKLRERAPSPSRSSTNSDMSAGAAVANLGSNWI
jgi:hypothetical protein